MLTLPLQNVKVRTRPQTGKIFFTSADLLHFPEWPKGPLIELLNGELYMVPSPSIRHQRISSEIHYQIKDFLKNKNLGEVIPAPVDVVLTDEDTVVPDIVYVSNSKRELIGENNIHGAPDLAIEIVSTNRRHDYVEKKELYEHYAVNEYWVVDPYELKVSVFVLNQEKKYGAPAGYDFNEEIPVISISGLSIRLSGLVETLKSPKVQPDESIE